MYDKQKLQSYENLKREYKSKKQQIQELSDTLEFPIVFLDDLEKHDKELIIKRSDGMIYHYSVMWKPSLIQDSNLIKLDYSLTESHHKPSASM